MATTKITVTVDDEQLKKIRRIVKRRKSTVAGFVRDSIELGLQNDSDDAFRKMLDEALAKTGGPLTDEEREWADAVLTGKRPGKFPKRRKAA